MSYLFTEDLLNSFTSDVKEKYKDYYVIYGQDIQEFDTNKLVLRKNKIVSKTKSPDFSLLLQNITNTCVGKNGSGVSKTYALSAIKKAMKKASFQDTPMHQAASSIHKHEIALIATKNNNKKITSGINKNNVLLKDIKGFILTQIGECGLYPDIPALKIICSNQSDVSRYLMYIYIKALLKAEKNIGLLELAGSYTNPAGFCLYNKFGFREDSMLDHNDCFHEGVTGGTLGMKVDLTDTGLINDLDDVLLGNKNMVELVSRTQTSEPMCDKTKTIGKVGDKQEEYINIRTKNRNYLKELFDRYDENEIKELLRKNEIDQDVLYGDGGVTDTNYALKELIEKGKIKADTEQKELNASENKRKRSSSSLSSTSTSNTSSNGIKHAKGKKNYKARTKKKIKYNKARTKTRFKGFLNSSSNSSSE